MARLLPLPISHRKGPRSNVFLLSLQDLMDQAEEPGTSDGGLIRPAVARRDMVLLMPVDTFQAHVYPCAAVCLTRLGISSLCVGGLVVSLARPMPGPDAPVHRRAASSSRVCPPGLKQHR